MPAWSPRAWLFFIAGLSLMLRFVVMLAAPDQLTLDRDLYLGIAEELRAGHGYCTPGSQPPRPTAYRPPLYPLVLAAVGDSPLAIGGLHLLLAVSTVVAIGLAAHGLARGHRLWVLAPTIVAVDPLLLLYSRQPMTETLCACLSAVLIWRVACRDEDVYSWKSACGEGFLWGLCLLARPTYGAVMAIWLVVEMYRSVTGKVHHGGTVARWNTGDSDNAPRATLPTRVRHLILVVAVSLLTLSPWAIRNWQVFGRPIMTTTHGGYTLLLANNHVYLKAVDGTFGVFDGKSLDTFQKANNQLLDESGIYGELARDRAMSRWAWQFIGSHPDWFVRACLFRARVFWAINPSRTAGNAQKLPMLWAVGGFYLTLWVGGVASLIRLFRMRSLPASAGFSTAFCLILGFFIVHLVYWTDVRMRAPIIPAVAVLVAAAWGSTGRTSKPTD